MSASVLVIAADLNIEALVGELIAFAGYRPVFDATLGAAGESVRRVRPHVAMVDTAISPEVVTMCVDAANEVASVPVLFSSTANTDELSQQAAAFECPSFVLPGGPKPLQDLLTQALADRPKPIVALPLRRDDVQGAVHPSFRAALASVARARLLAIQVAAAQREQRVVHEQMRMSHDEMRRSRSALRAAVIDYTRQLKATDAPLERIVSVVQSTVADCAAVVGADAAMPALLLESEEWVRSEFFDR